MCKARILAALIIGALMLSMVGPQLALADPFGTPVNFAPVDNATDIGPTFVFEFTNTPDADGDPADNDVYATQWQWRTASGSYALPLYDSGILVRNEVKASAGEQGYPEGVFAYNTQYYWRVRVQNNRGQWSEWSDETSFTTVANLPPSQPENFNPDHNATSVARNPVLAASEFRDPNYDRAELVLGQKDEHGASRWEVAANGATGKNPDGSYAAPVFNSGEVTAGDELTSFYIDLDHQLAASTRYYFHVRYQDSYGNWSAWSDETSFTTGTNSSNLSQPVNMSPFDGAADISPDHRLQSSPFYSASGATHQASYWQIAAAGAAEKNLDGGYLQPLFDSRIDSSNLVSMGIPAGIADYGATYYWHVRYQDSTGAWSIWSNETSFTIVGNLPPSTPVNLQPASGAEGLAATPVLTASGFSDYDSSAYAALTDSHHASRWQVRTSSGTYDSPAWDSGDQGAAAVSTQVPGGNLKGGATYYWHVRYQDSHGNWSSWSIETSFTTRSLPAPVAAFGADRTSIVVGEDLVIFTDNSTPAGEIQRWTWDFGDGATENWTKLTKPTGGKIVHKYGADAAGPRTVKLTVYNAGAATGVSQTMTVTVHTKPAASFTSAPASVSAGAAITITDASTSPGEITSWEWWFDDGTRVTWASPADREAVGGKISHAFSKAGMHTLSLTVKGPLGDSYYSQQIRVNGGGGFHFGLWMIAAAAAAVAVMAGVVYLVRGRKAK